MIPAYVLELGRQRVENQARRRRIRRRVMLRALAIATPTIAALALLLELLGRP